MQMWRAEPFLHEETFGSDTGSEQKDNRIMHKFAQVFSLLFPRFFFFFKDESSLGPEISVAVYPCPLYANTGSQLVNISSLDLHGENTHLIHEVYQLIWAFLVSQRLSATLSFLLCQKRKGIWSNPFTSKNKTAYRQFLQVLPKKATNPDFPGKRLGG